MHLVINYLSISKLNIEAKILIRIHFNIAKSLIEFLRAYIEYSRVVNTTNIVVILLIELLFIVNVISF